MVFTRRAFGRLAVAAAALTAAPRAAVSAVPLSLEDYFSVPTRGIGRFRSDLFDLTRELVVDTTSSWDGRTLILNEDIAYKDGQRERAVWRFEKTGPASYDGKRSRVAGVVPVRVVEGAVRMGYVAETVGADGKLVKLRFDDTLVQTDARTVVNTARVSFLGLTVGDVEITFKRRG